MSNTFCGVPFAEPPEVYDGILPLKCEDDRHDFQWMEEYVIVKRAPDFSEWYVLTPTAGLAFDGLGHLPLPSTTAKDEDDENDRGSPGFVSFSHRGSEDVHLPIVYPNYLFCHETLTEIFLRLSPGIHLTPTSLGTFFSSIPLAGNGRGLDPIWSDIGYGGAEQLWKDDWEWMQEPKFTDDDQGLDRDYYWDFLVFDPTDLDFVADIVSTPPVLASGLESASLVQQDTNTMDVFGKLPYHIMEEILQLLPTESVKAFRHACRAAARHQLSNQFWKSRFRYPHELSYVPLSSIPSSQFRTQINFKALRHRILEPSSEENPEWMTYEERSHHNRQRISRIIRKFVVSLLASLANDYGSPAIRKEGKWDCPRLLRTTISSHVEAVTGRVVITSVDRQSVY